MPIDLALDKLIAEGDFEKAYHTLNKDKALAKGVDGESGETLLHRMAAYKSVNDALKKDLREEKLGEQSYVMDLMRLIILNNKSMLRAQDKNGRTALSVAVRTPGNRCNEGTALFLLQQMGLRKSDDELAISQDKMGNTVLHHALYTCCPEVIDAVLKYFPRAVEMADKKDQIPLATALRLYVENPTDVSMGIMRQLFEFIIKQGMQANVLTRVTLNNDWFAHPLWEYAVGYCVKETNVPGKKDKKIEVNGYLVDFIKEAATELSNYFGNIAISYVLGYVERQFSKQAYNQFMLEWNSQAKRDHRTATLASTNRFVRTSATTQSLRTVKPLTFPKSQPNVLSENKVASSSSQSLAPETAASTVVLSGLQRLSLMKPKSSMPVSDQYQAQSEAVKDNPAVNPPSATTASHAATAVGPKSSGDDMIDKPDKNGQLRINSSP